MSYHDRRELVIPGADIIPGVNKLEQELKKIETEAESAAKAESGLRILRNEIPQITRPYLDALRSKALELEIIHSSLILINSANIHRETRQEYKPLPPKNFNFLGITVFLGKPRETPILVDYCNANWQYEGKKLLTNLELNYKSYSPEEVEVIQFNADIEPNITDKLGFVPRLQLKVRDGQVNIVRFFFPYIDIFDPDDQLLVNSDLDSLLTQRVDSRAKGSVSTGIDFQLEELTIQTAKYQGGDLSFGSQGASSLGERWFSQSRGSSSYGFISRVQAQNDPRSFLNNSSALKPEDNTKLSSFSNSLFVCGIIQYMTQLGTITDKNQLNNPTKTITGHDSKRVSKNSIVDAVKLVEKLAGSVPVPEKWKGRDIDEIIAEAKDRYFRERYARKMGK